MHKHHAQEHISCMGMNCPYVNHRGEYEFWKHPHYRQYIQTHGHHFSPALSDHASMALKNSDGTDHIWSREDVSAALKKMKVTLPMHVKLCDVTYVANKKYAKYFGSSVKTEEQILELTLDSVTHASNYEGKYFDHYLTDCMNKGHVIDFEKVM